MSIINLEEIKEIMDNDMELIQECFADFLIEYPDLIGGIKAAIANKAADDIDNAAHKLKGTLRYLAAEPAASAAQTIETAGHQHDLDNLDEKLSILEAECQKVIIFIDEFTP